MESALQLHPIPYPLKLTTDDRIRLPQTTWVSTSVLLTSLRFLPRIKMYNHTDLSFSTELPYHL